jgi:hypothetical protein
MEKSASYIAIEAMIQYSQVTMNFAELEEFLEMLEKKRLITASERLTLLELATEKQIE